MTISLRAAGPADLPAVGALHHRSRVAAYRDILPADALAAVSAEMMGRWWVERWPYERDTHVMTLAERDGRLAGFSYVGPDEDGEARTGELYAIHLEPDQEGTGVGRALIIDALATLHRHGWRRAVLWVLADNAHARQFYEQGGWTADGTERDAMIGSAVTCQLRYSHDLP